MGKKREQILRTAAALFLNNSVSSVTMDMIAAAVPASKMTIYRYFHDKDVLARESLCFYVDETVRQVQEAMASASSAGDLLDRMFMADFAGFQTPSNEFAVDLANKHPELAAWSVGYAQEKAFAVFTELISRAQQEGRVRSDLSAFVIVLCIRAIKLYLARPGVVESGQQMNDLAGQVRSLLLHGITVSKE